MTFWTHRSCAFDYVTFISVYVIVTITISTVMTHGNDKNPHVITLNIHAVAGSSTKMECNVKQTSGMDQMDQITKVSWSRYSNSTTPIYSFDLRGGQLLRGSGGVHPTMAATQFINNVLERQQQQHQQQLRHGTNIDNGIYLRVEDTHRPLQFQHIIDNVRLEDEGIYKCTVHYQKSAPYITVVNLTVIVDIRELVIIDWSGRVLKSHKTQPLPEGASANITCIAYGGKPLARVTWWKGGVLVDSTDEISEDGQLTTNVLSIPKVTRKDLLTTYSCEASNSDDSNHVPITTQVTIEMYLRPLEVRLEGKVDGLSVGVRHEIICRMRGCRPPGKITWWKDGFLIKDADVVETVGENGNLTMSTLGFIPEISDQGMTLSCRGNNPTIPFSELKDTVMLHVLYPPQVILKFGSKLNASNIHEGVDVYFECHITANPWIYRVMWSHDGKIVHNNVSSGIIISNQTLVIQGVSRKASGYYTCSATNSQGTTESNALHLNIKYEPVCNTTRTVYGTARMEEIRVDCFVDANPPPTIFRWTFNHTPAGDSRTISTYDTNIYDGHSVATFTPITDRDYGSLLCWSRNELGPQQTPCVFHIVPAGRPETPSNCSAINRTHSSIHVKCKRGFDGGLNQKFVMLVTYGINDQMVVNITSDGIPEFHVNGLEPETFYKVNVFAINEKGVSRNSKTLYVRTLSMPLEQKRLPVQIADADANTNNETEEEKPPWLYILLGIISSLIVTSLVLCIVFHWCYKDSSKQYMNSKRLSKDTTECSTASATTKTPPQNNESTDLEVRSNIIEEEENNPDIIPHDVFFYQQMGSRAMSPSQILSCNGQMQPVPLTMTETYQLSNMVGAAAQPPIIYQGSLETSLPLSHIHGAQWMTDVSVTTIPHKIPEHNVASSSFHQTMKNDVQTQTSLVRRKESTV